MKHNRVFDDKTGKFVAHCFQFGSMNGAGPWVPRVRGMDFGEEHSRFFPGIISFHLRDQHGINPGIIWSVIQFGDPSPEMPHGYTGTYRGFFLFGDRLSEK